MSAKTKVQKVRCRCTAKVRRARAEGYKAAVKFLRSEWGLRSLIGTPRADGLVLRSFCWGPARRPTFQEILRSAPTGAELLRREEAIEGRQH